MPENTVKAFRTALASGYGFEMDLQILADGNVIILHDNTLWRTAAVSWVSWLLSRVLKGSMLTQPVHTLNIEQARTVLVGDRWHSEPVPTLSEALNELRNPPPLTGTQERRRRRRTPKNRLVHCFAEIKADGYSATASFDPRLTEAAAKAVAKAGVAPEQLTWVSFSLGALVDIKRRMPKHAAYLVAYVQTAEQAWALAQRALQSGLDGIDINADTSVVTKELVDWLHARGQRMAVWVFRAPAANDVKEVWEHMERCGVDFFTSNLPPALDSH